jgi:Ca-activated chloride channel family protein
MIRKILIVVGGLGAVTGAEFLAQQINPADTAVPANAAVTAGESDLDLSGLPAYKAVREGNRRLIDGHAASALEAYEYAKGLRPDALEIPFVEGLAHFTRKEYDQARDAFRKAAKAEAGRLAGDALYSIGTTYHAEAFENLQDPKLTIEKLENAMQRYRDVLADQPEHESARDANFKAASMRRQLLQMLEQQQQDQPQDQQCDQENQDQQDRQNQQPQEQNDQEQDQERQSQPSSESEEPPEEQSSQSPSPDEEQEQQEEQPQVSPEEEEQRVSREQAERRLREMMQAIRDRQKLHRKEVQKIPVAPVDKDW